MSLEKANIFINKNITDPLTKCTLNRIQTNKNYKEKITNKNIKIIKLYDIIFKISVRVGLLHIYVKKYIWIFSL